jgi:cation:H+ antiporter
VIQTILFLALLALGLAILTAGGEMLVRGATGLARSLGVSALTVGLTVVAFGTSAPELSLDVTAVLRGSADLAFGDLVGSNIANIGLVLAAAAMVRPLKVRMQLLRLDVPIVIAASVLAWAMAADGAVDRADAVVLLGFFGAYMLNMVRLAQRESRAIQAEFAAGERAPGTGRSALLSVLGLAALVGGAQLMVYGAVGLARQLGVSELAIGLTIVAVGTSLPELSTAVVAARRGHADIAVGNVVGSNAFNLLFVMAVVALVAPLPVRGASLAVDLPVMLGFAVLLVPVMLRGGEVRRSEGVLLAAAYVAYLALRWQAP